MSADGTAGRPPAATLATAPASAEGSATPYRVVLADDVAALRKLVRLALESGGRFKVVAEAGNGLEAIAKAGELQPDLVLLDLSMPELDGLEALPRVLASAPRSHVVVLSGFNHVRMAPIALRLGASAYLEKGMEPADLVRQLLTILEMPTAAPPPPALAPTGPPGPGPGPRHGAAGGRPSTPAAAAAAAAKPDTFRTLVLAPDDARARVLTELLRGGRFAARRAATPAEAADLLRAGQADLLLADPPEDPQAAEDFLIATLTAAPAVPVVALLPPHDEERMQRAMRLGVEDCVPREGLARPLLERSLLYALERRRAQEARRTARDQEILVQRLREVDRLKSEFFNAAAHELGTPLTPIKLQMTRLKMMRRGADEKEQRSLEILDRNVQRLLRLNQDILDVARLAAGHFSLQRQAMHLDDLVHEARDMFEPVARERGIRLTATCSPEASLEGDATRLGQVLYNLVSNALKFTNPGGSVAIEGSADDQACTLVVRDDGVGLRPDQIAQLFKPFSQVLGDAQPRGIGSGLGLFVSRGIVGLHGGTITCSSAGPGQGSTFTIRIPRMAAPDDEKALVPPLADRGMTLHHPAEVAAEA